MCTTGCATVLAESKEHAKKVFKNSIDEEWKDAYEHQITGAKRNNLKTSFKRCLFAMGFS